MDNIKVLGIDLAKNVFQLHGTDASGHAVLRKRLKRGQLLSYMSNIPPCLVGIEACGGSHYWARQFELLGHTVKIMSPQLVKPYVTRNKTDKNDAEAIAEAVTRPRMRFTSAKSIEQQDIQSLHRIREKLVKQRTSLSNQIRGLLLEYGIAIPQGISHVRNQLGYILEDAENELTVITREIVDDLRQQFREVDERVDSYTKKLEQIAKTHELCRRVMTIDGVGPLTSTALIAAIGDGKAFKNGRHVAAYLGLVPKQKSSGDKVTLLGISKRGNCYLRQLFIHGARAVIRHCEKKEDKRSVWLKEKIHRSHVNIASVALANKNVRVAWAMLVNQTNFDLGLA